MELSLHKLAFIDDSGGESISPFTVIPPVLHIPFILGRRQLVHRVSLRSQSSTIVSEIRLNLLYNSHESRVQRVYFKNYTKALKTMHLINCCLSVNRLSYYLYQRGHLEWILETLSRQSLITFKPIEMFNINRLWHFGYLYKGK